MILKQEKRSLKDSDFQPIFGESTTRAKKSSPKSSIIFDFVELFLNESLGESIAATVSVVVLVEDPAKDDGNKPLEVEAVH